MTFPVTGPFTRVDGGGEFYKLEQEWHRQARPYDLVLPFKKSEAWITQRRGLGPQLASAVAVLDLMPMNPGGATDIAWNKARSRMLDQIGSTASLGVSLAQSKQAWVMIASRLGQLAAFARGVRNLDAKAVSRGLGISVRRAHHVMLPYRDRVLPRKRVSPYGYSKRDPVKDRHETERALADLWLEFWFGWKPMVSDIQSAVEVLDAPINRTQIRGTGRSTAELLIGLEGPAQVHKKLKCTSRVAMGAEVEVTNPNLRLAQQLGVLNPAVVALDVIPWSFVFGWAVNLQDYLSSFTDFAGLTLHKAYISKKVTCQIEWTWTSCSPLCPPSEVPAYTQSLHKGEGIKKVREAMTSVPRPVLRVDLNPLSLTRGLTAVSLLLQKMPKLPG